MIAFRAAILTLLALALGGCASLWFGDSAQGRRGNSSSLVDFLYPNGSIPDKPPETLPYLELPIRVGIAFVPPPAARHCLPMSSTCSSSGSPAHSATGRTSRRSR